MKQNDHSINYYSGCYSNFRNMVYFLGISSKMVNEGKTMIDTCIICGKPANPKFFYNQKHHCSSKCKWTDMWTTECSKPGIRPTMLNAWEEVKRAVHNRQGNRCAICQKKLKWSEEEYHHVVPLFLGGNSLPENVIMLCHECHQDIHYGINRKRPRVRVSKDDSDPEKTIQTKLIEG